MFKSFTADRKLLKANPLFIIWKQFVYFYMNRNCDMHLVYFYDKQVVYVFCYKRNVD